MTAVLEPRHRLRETLDARRWSTVLAIRCFDVPLKVRISDDALVDDVLACLPPGWRTDPSWPPSPGCRFSVRLGGRSTRTGSPRIHIYRDSQRLFRATDRHLAMLTLESAMRFCVASTRSRWLFIHAGSVGWRGRALVIPGESGAGKTSLVRALVEAGATYYSDEYTVLDESGLVWPFPKPLSIRVGPARGRDRVAVDTFGGRVGDGPLPIGLVVATQYAPDGVWRPSVLTAGAAAMALLAHTVRARDESATVLGRLKTALSGASGVESPRGDAVVTAAALLAGSEGHGYDRRIRGERYGDDDDAAGTT